MTTVLPNTWAIFGRTRAAVTLRWALLVGVVCGPAAVAQQPPVHWLHAGVMPPGAIGNLRHLRGGPVSGYFQPVRIRAPEGARISLAEEGGLNDLQSSNVLVGMLIGPVYRLQVSGVGPHQDQTVYPTIEVVDRLYPPANLATRYPIPIELTADELDMATQGMFVTRVIYLENPNEALPVNEKPSDEQQWVEAPHGADPLVVADEMGRPVAILRIGGRVPRAMGTAFDACPAPWTLCSEPVAQ
jgi:hypothetical protein